MAENGDTSPLGSKRCPICNDAFTTPKSLSCHHTYCLSCLEKIQNHPKKVTCTVCLQDTTLSSQGIQGLYTDYSANVIDKNSIPPCTDCKNKKTNAVAQCFQCNNFLCASCVMAHQIMHSFEGHRVTDLDVKEEPVKNELGSLLDKINYCPRHKTELVKMLCTTCNTLICQECIHIDHPASLHHKHERLPDIGPEQLDLLSQLSHDALTKATELYKNAEQNQSLIQMQYHKAQNRINKTFQFYLAMIEDRKEELLKELDSTFAIQQDQNSIAVQKTQECLELVNETCETIDSLVNNASSVQICHLKRLLDIMNQTLNSYSVDFSQPDLEFRTNLQAIQVGVQNTFGYVRTSIEVASGPCKQPSIARPTNEVHVSPNQDMLDLSSNLMSTAMLPPKSPIQRQKIKYYRKFGKLGMTASTFNEPTGVAVNAQNDIIVADSKNHRIQIFDKDGRFKFQFGGYGNRDGQLFYPNRVAVVRTSGDIIITERPPNHQIHIYNHYGQFIRKFGADILRHPRGLTVDNKGLIIVVESKVMKVIMFDQSGNVLHKFGCKEHLAFPNDVVVNNKQEIFISDNHAHCVIVFNYEGSYLRQISDINITHFPIGVGINSADEIFIAHVTTNFNLTIFTRDGTLVSALESTAKHGQCFGFALINDESVVLISKDNRLYIYRYAKFPPIAL